MAGSLYPTFEYKLARLEKTPHKMSNGQDNIRTEEATSQNDNGSTRKDSYQKGDQEIMMSNFGKILLAICGVQMAALVVGAGMMKDFLQAIPAQVSLNHDDSVIGTMERKRNRHDIQKNADATTLAAINQKGMEKALYMLSGDVKHLSRAVGEQNKKLDLLGGYWSDFNNPPNTKQWADQ